MIEKAIKKAQMIGLSVDRKTESIELFHKQHFLRVREMLCGIGHSRSVYAIKIDAGGNVCVPLDHLIPS